MKKLIVLALVVMLVLSFAAMAIAKPIVTNNIPAGGTLTVDFAPGVEDHPVLEVEPGVGASFQ